MSILICTPCYGGMLTLEYVEGLMETQEAMIRSDIAFGTLLTQNESLVQRARNTLCASFLKTDFQKMLFVDADIRFSAQDVAHLWNLQADVAVGLYRMKKEGAPLAAWVNGKMVEDLPAEPFEVDYAGTGFMMIDRTVLESFRLKWPERAHEEGFAGDCFAWFDPGVRFLTGLPEIYKEREGAYYCSEDYAFCADWRSMGGKIVAHPEVKLGHVGRQIYE